MTQLIADYWFLFLAFGVATGYFLLLAIFFLRQGNDPSREVSLWWYFLIGPPALLRWYALKKQRHSLLSKRELWGWVGVACLMAVIIVWKLATKP